MAEAQHLQGDEGKPEGDSTKADDRMEMLRTHHHHTLWVHWALILMGIWLIMAPFSLGYQNEEFWCQPSGGRGVWLGAGTHDALRTNLMVGSDIVSGLLLTLFGWRSLTANRPLSMWMCCAIGGWLVCAPVFFWAPTVAAFYNGSLVGMLVIALTILIPGMPNMIVYMQHGPGTPPGWTYNPSSWAQRWILIATGFFGYLVSRQLAMYQMGYIDQLEDPFFGRGTELVLNSSLSHKWPISDAGLGTVAYTFEFLMGFMGSPKRWRTMPWMVAFFGILVIPLGLVHILLVLSQPIMVGAWCTLCLVAAGIMLPMIPLEVDEVVAMMQHVKQAARRGDRNGSWNAIFWKGGSAEGCREDDRTPPLHLLPRRKREVLGSMFWGFRGTPFLTLSTLLGTWLMFQPTVLGITGAATADNALRYPASANLLHACGALIVVISVIAMGEVVRAGRLLNLPIALTVLAAPWFVGPVDMANAALASLCGVLVFLFSLPRGAVRESYGAWDKMVI